MRTSRLGERRQSVVTRTEGEGRLGGWGTICDRLREFDE